MSSAGSMRDVIRTILILDVVFGLICPLFAVAPDYEFDLHLYQQNISWLQCPEGWTNFGIKCFKVITDKASFEESEINCQSYGGHLVHIDRLNKNLLLGERALNEGVQGAAWIGFWREVNGSYQWTNDEFGDKNHAFWTPGQPQILHDDLKLCTYMIINLDTNQFRWVLDRCEVKRGFICETDACVVGDFRCGSGQCVSPQWRCDGKSDCPDRSDEQNCGTDLCGEFVEGFQIKYPNQTPYKPWLNCQWKIRAPIGYKVKLQITHLDTEPMYDVVGVYDGLSTQSRLIGNFSGQDIPPDVISTTNFLLVTLTTDHSTEKTGFSAKWSSVLSLCDSSLETLEADNEIKWVTSPGYPEKYSDNLQCSWIIRAVREEHVTLTVIDVDLLPADWLEIRDGASRESTLIHRYSGRVQNDVLVSNGRHFYLHLHTDLKGSGTGFNISYHSGCDVTISGGYGRISSPGFHAGNRYPNNLQCSWTLQDINNRQSTLIFNFFHTEPSYDFVQIYNATTISSETLLLNRSGWHPMSEPLRSPIGHFIIHFQTDNLVNKAGWSASFSFDCYDDTPLQENLSATSSRAGYQSYISYSCDKGYQLEGASKRFCDKDGIWNSTVPLCKLINCGAPHPLVNGVLLNVTSRNYDGVAYYNCNPGHGDTDIVYKVTCLEQGWVGMPMCNPMECPKLKAVPNGIIHSPYLYRIHARADFKCHHGYRINGHMTSECLHGGHWSRPEPICVQINITLCEEVKVIHGTINQTGPIMVGETLQITCKAGYQLYPAKLDIITCMDSGQYDQQIPQCTDVDECQSNNTCGPQHTCHNTGGGFWCECMEGYQHIDLEDPLCEDIDECSVNNGNCEQDCVNTEGGYQCSCSGVSRLYEGDQTQLINGRLLVPGQSCYVVCENQSIERSERLIYTTTPLPDGSYLYPTSLHIICPHGAFPDGPPLVTCKQDGTWSANVTKCLVRQCGHLDDLEKGDIVYTSDREAGSFANYTCHRGYSLHGNRSRFCHAMVDDQGDITLTWTGSQPVCEPVDCHAPPSVRNGNVSYPSTRFKNVAIYSCNHGYRLKDVSYRTCLFSGLWSTDEILCVAQTCPWLQPPVAGSLTSNSTWYGDGAVVSFTCNAGYQLSDPSPMLCYIPEPFPDDVASTNLPHLEFDVSFTVYSSEALDKIKQNCSIHYSQELHGRLEMMIRRLIPYTKCAWPSDAGSEIIHKDIKVNTVNKTTHEVIIKKKVSIYPAHTLLPSPVRGEEDCFAVFDKWDVVYLPNNSACERTATNKIEILEPVELVCKDGVPFQHGDVTFCVNIKQDTAHQDPFMVEDGPIKQTNGTVKVSETVPASNIPETSVKGVSETTVTEILDNYTNHDGTLLPRIKDDNPLSGDSVLSTMIVSTLSTSYLSPTGIMKTDAYKANKTVLKSEQAYAISEEGNPEHQVTKIVSSAGPSTSTLICSSDFSTYELSPSSYSVIEQHNLSYQTSREWTSSKKPRISGSVRSKDLSRNKITEDSKILSAPLLLPSTLPSSFIETTKASSLDSSMGITIRSFLITDDSGLKQTILNTEKFTFITEEHTYLSYKSDIIATSTMNYVIHHQSRDMSATGIVTEPTAMFKDTDTPIKPTETYKESHHGTSTAEDVVQMISEFVDVSKLRPSVVDPSVEHSWKQKLLDLTSTPVHLSVLDSSLASIASLVKRLGTSFDTVLMQSSTATSESDILQPLMQYSTVTSATDMLQSFMQSTTFSPEGSMLQSSMQPTTLSLEDNVVQSKLSEVDGNQVESVIKLPQIGASEHIQASMEHEPLPRSRGVFIIDKKTSTHYKTVADIDAKESVVSPMEMYKSTDVHDKAVIGSESSGTLETSVFVLDTSILNMDTSTSSVTAVEEHTRHAAASSDIIISSSFMTSIQQDFHVKDGQSLDKKAGYHPYMSSDLHSTITSSSWFSSSHLIDGVTDVETSVNSTVTPSPYTCSCNQSSLPDNIHIKTGPVFMLQVNFILRFTTQVTNTSSNRLRELVRLGIDDMVNTMRFDEKCPGLHKPVLTNASGSLQVEDKKIEVKIPFFLHDNTSPFHEVQHCERAIQMAITSTFKNMIRTMVQQLNVECPNISFSFADSDFTIPVTQEMCQVQYEFDNSSNKCVFCGSCGSLNTTISTTTSTTTPAPSSSSSTPQSTQPASSVTSTTELSTSAFVSSVAPTDSSPLSSTSDAVSITSDTASTTSTTVSITSDTVSTSDTASTTSHTVSSTSDTASTSSAEVLTTMDPSSESTLSTTTEITTLTSNPSPTTISGEQFTITSTKRTSSTTTQATTTPSLGGCSIRSNSINETVLQDLDFSVQQTKLLFTSSFQVDTFDPFCLELYESRMKELIDIQEVKINLFLNVKTKCTDKGTYVRYTNLKMTAAGNNVTMTIAASLTRIAGAQFSSVSEGTISLCVAAIVNLPELRHVKCLCYSSVLETGSNLCSPIPLTNTMSYTGQSKSCNQGWSNLNNMCVQDKPSTTASSSTTTSTTTATSSIQTTTASAPTSAKTPTTPVFTSMMSTTTTTTETAPTPTTDGVIEETTMAGMHECYICDHDRASSNAECMNTFESCTMENPVCMTQVRYQGKSGQYTLQKTCSAQNNCKREQTNSAGLCDRGSPSAYCVYCCNTSKCNLDVEFLTFKGRRKRSTKESVPTLTAQWNNTAPVCKDEERPMFTNCPSGVIVVNDSKLPVSVNVSIPAAVDNSGIKPSINIFPTNFTTPYWIYHSTNITFTATDGAGLVTECVVRIQVKDLTPPTLNCPRNILKVYKDITERAVQVDYADITANLSGMVDLNSFQRRSMTPDITDSVLVLEEFLVTLAVWDHANNSATCSFLMMYIPLGCPPWTLGSPLNVTLINLSSTTVKAQCEENSIMVHSGNASAVIEYTCEEHAKWTPTGLTPDCIPADLSVCPEWVYNVSWKVTPDSFMSIQPQCDITGSLTAQIQRVLNTLSVNIDILLIQNSTHNGIITVTSSFKMTSNNLISAVCPSVRQVQGHLDNLDVSSVCQGSALLTNVTILGVQMDCAGGLAMVENNQEGGRCWPCPRGMAAKTAVCELCPIGTYRDNLTSTVCSPCPVNMSTKNNGSISLTDCKKFCLQGWFSPSGLAPCIKCQPGTYQGETGGKHCLSCKPEFGNSKYGSTSQSECKAQCRENEYSSTGFEPCMPCPYGYYNNQTQSTRCYRCTELHSSFLSCSERCGDLLCGEHGTCVNAAQGYRCQCHPTYTGVQCDVPLSSCDEVLCQNGGTCEATNNSSMCSCTPGYTGVFCETKLEACYSSPCLNGLCQHTDDSFTCKCFQGYKGRLCDQRENRCVNHKCQHGKCISLLEGYICNCTGTGYYGEFCDSMEEYCQEGTCLNGGRCENAPNGFSCTCPPGYEGLVCEKRKDLCTESSCLNGGQCVTDIAGQTSCICKSGYSGEKCQTDDQLCQVNPCQNQATCVRFPDKTTCQCKQGFTGEHCELPLTIGCKDEPCDRDNILECLGSDEGVTCICKSGWKGKYCEEIDDLCQSNPCQNGGKCENHGTHFTCVCLQGYAGNRCQDDVDECRSNPCMNGGTCTDQFGGYTCMCSPHFYGDTCHMEIDGCVSNPCVHGTCLDGIEGFHCMCNHDWTGTQCDKAINKCLSLPCENGGSCHQNGTEFTCTCEPRYTGMVCEFELTPCEPNPCNNGGVCTGMNATFTCTCPSGYHGDACDLVMNVCDMVQCEHGGTCIEEDFGGRCVCTSLYTGKHCEKEKSVDFDMTVTGEVLVVCETELVLEELTGLTLCLTYRVVPSREDGLSYSTGLILKVMDEMNETLLTVSADKLEISFWNDSRPVVVKFGPLGVLWHQICLTWSSLNGQWSVYVDQRLQDQGLNYGTNRNLSQFKLSTRQPTTPLFQGQITGVNVYRTVLDIRDLDHCTHGNRGDVISWAMFDQCQSETEGVSVTYPSACPSSQCLPGYKGDHCNILIDKTPPIVEYCPDDLVSVITVDELRTVVTWKEPVFYDNIEVVRINQTYYSGDVFTYGEYQVIYMAFDADDNHASCLFHVIVTSGHCKIPPHPLNGQRSCDAQGHSFTHCSISCLDPSLYKFTEEPAQLYICREAGVWDPPRGKQFTFPPCAGFSAPSQSYQGVILLKDQTCSESVKLNLIHQLQQQFYQTGLCETAECQTSSVIVDCVIVNSKKRSTEPVQYKVTFNIPSPSSNSTINSTAVTNSFEQFVKEGMVNYTVEDFTMEVQLQCASGQVLSADKEFCVNCGKGYYFSSDTRRCELCPLGSFSAAERQVSCTSCDITQSTLTEGSISQEDCFYVCDAGYYLLDGECEPCEIGYYEDRNGSTQCKPCRLGYTTLTNASTNISQCYFPCDMIGYTMSSEGSCVPCPRGWYKAERFDVACRPCPAGFTTLDEGAGSENLCTLVVCNLGYWRNAENKCDPCPIGTYQNVAGQDFCHRCPPGHTTSETGVQSVEACIQGEVNECLLQTDNCPDKSVCKDTEESFECECILGYSKLQDGSCIDNCLDVCIHGDCEYDSAGNPVCKCYDDYQGLKCDDEIGGLSAGSIIGISVAVLFAVVLLVFVVFVCLRQTSSVKGTERQLLRFPIHRTDLRSSFRAIALAMNPFESSTDRTMSTVLKGNRRKSKMSNTNTSENFSNKSSSPSKTSYF